MNRAHIAGVLLVVVAGAASVWVLFERQPTVPDSIPMITEDGTIATSTDVYDIEISAPPGDKTGARDVVDYVGGQNSAFIADAEAAYEEYTDAGAEYPWRQYVLAIEHDTYEIGGYTSYIVREYRYTGGANGIQLVETFTYDPDGERLSLADIVASESRDELVETLKEELHEILSGNNGFSDAVDSLTFDALEHFYLTDTDIVIVFPQYDIAPGAAGVVEVPLPREMFSTI